jgi:uncharacterized membrane protein YhaH (DUF805 family)
MNYYTDVFKKYAVFEGRARRAEYWYFLLFNLIIAFALTFLDSVLHSQIPYALYLLVAIVPSLAVSVRRLHDTGHSGWWLLLDFVPIVGAIILLIWLATDSEPGMNQYGPNPKGVESSSEPQVANTAA